MVKINSLKPRAKSLGPRVKAAPKVADPFYQSAAWKSLLARLKRERGVACEWCGGTHRVAGDHVIERRDGGADLDPANVVLLDQTCHNAKTAAVRRARNDGRDIAAAVEDVRSTIAREAAVKSEG